MGVKHKVNIYVDHETYARLPELPPTMSLAGIFRRAVIAELAKAEKPARKPAKRAS